VTAGLSVPQVTTRIFLLSFLLAALAIVTVVADRVAVDLLCLGLGAAVTALTLHALGSGR
jgi:hypothetical protein